MAARIPKNCPFCGSNDIHKSLMPGMTWVVGCNNCGCRTQEYTHSVDAEDSWNRRAGDQNNPAADDGTHSTKDDDDFRSAREIIMDMGMPSINETPF